MILNEIYTKQLSKTNLQLIKIGNTIKITYYDIYFFNKKIQINSYSFNGICIQYNKKNKNITLFKENNNIGIKQQFKLNSHNIVKIENKTNNNKISRAKLYSNLKKPKYKN